MKLLLAVLSGVMCLPVFLRADRLDEFVREEMARHGIPGVALAVIRADEKPRVSTFGVANVEWQIPVGTNTVFEIGSLTKQFTAAGILLLAQDGRLAVDDLITKHLTNTPAAWSNITIRHLLTHSSGLRNYTGLDGFEVRRRLSQAQFIELLGRQPLDFAPGAQAKYCNSGFNLLGHIIENTSGLGCWKFMEERLWKPLGMNSVTTRDLVAVVTNRASGYVRKGGVLRNRDSDLTDVFAAGAMAATIVDLVKWNAALDAGLPLSAANREPMWTAGRLNSGEKTAYGFGWRVAPWRGRKNIGHSGSTSGFSASLQRFPDDRFAVIVLCNFDEQNIATTLARGIVALHFGEPPGGEK
jgi:CubicO group peptidase (beta-lactamase class C family)